MKGIILAGGRGTRLYPITIETSKQLLPVYDKPMIYYPLATLMQAGIRDILIIATPKDICTYRNLLDDGNLFGINLSYAVQHEPAGIAQAFIIGEEFINNEPVALILGDNIFDEEPKGNFSGLLHNAEFESTYSAKATIFTYKVDNPWDFGIVESDKNGYAISIEEKPKDPKSNCGVTGLYIYDKHVVEYAKELKPSSRNELEITDLNLRYLHEGRLRVEKLDNNFVWFDTGTYDRLIEASNYVRIVEKYQNRQIACLEEIAYRRHWITYETLRDSYENTKNSQYGQYLLDILTEKEKVAI